jgi:RpiB/LacA/LacB family sugar-phosphate isomerase
MSSAGPVSDARRAAGDVRRPMLGAGLKMYLGYRQTVEYLTRLRELAAGLAGEMDLFVLPSFPVLAEAQRILAGSGIAHGAQDVHWDQSGPYTGEVSASMLRELGCTLVEIGHAERRLGLGETDEQIAAKVAAAAAADLTPLLCVGERQRQAPAEATRVVLQQLSAGLARADGDFELIVAYEPIWAIGAEAAAEPERVAPVVSKLSDALAGRRAPWRILYGGSVAPGRLAGLVQTGISGLFVGRAALAPEGLLEIAHELLGPADDSIGTAQPRTGQPESSTRPTPKPIAIGSDDAGYELKRIIGEYLLEQGFEVSDFGCESTEPVDYPDVAERLARSVADGRHERGILVCGTGIGMAMTANKVPGVRAAQAHDPYSAERARKSNNAQVLALGARVVAPELAKSLVDTWLKAEFAGGASARKVAKIEELDRDKGGAE